MSKPSTSEVTSSCRRPKNSKIKTIVPKPISNTWTPATCSSRSRATTQAGGQRWWLSAGILSARRWTKRAFTPIRNSALYCVALGEKKKQEQAAAVSESPESGTVDTGGSSLDASVTGKNTQSTRQIIPVLGDMPYIGALFRTSFEQARERQPVGSAEVGPSARSDQQGDVEDLSEGNEIGRIIALNLGYSFCVIRPHKGHLLKKGDRVQLPVNRGRVPAVTATVTVVDHQHAIAEFPSEAGPQINVRAPVYRFLPGVGLPQFRRGAEAGKKSDGMDGRQAAADGLPQTAAKAANAGPTSVPTPAPATNNWSKPPTILYSPTENSQPAPYLEPVVPECVGLEFLPDTGGARLTWFSQTGRTLRIEVSSDLTTWIAAGSASGNAPRCFRAHGPLRDQHWVAFLSRRRAVAVADHGSGGEHAKNGPLPGTRYGHAGRERRSSPQSRAFGGHGRCRAAVIGRALLAVIVIHQR